MTVVIQKFRYFLILLNFFFIAKSAWAMPFCDYLKTQNKATVLRGMAEVEDFRNRIPAIIETCGVDLSKSVSPQEYETLKVQGVRSQLDVYENRLKSQAQYGKVDRGDYAKIMEYRAILRKNGGTDDLALLQGMGMMNEGAGIKNCGAVDLSSQMGPIRDQDSVGFCHAVAAADLLSYKLKNRISAASIMVQYNANEDEAPFVRFMGKKESELFGGQTDEAIRIGLDKGLCLEKDFPSEYAGNGEFAPKNLYDFMKKTESAAKKNESQKIKDKVLDYTSFGVLNRLWQNRRSPACDVTLPSSLMSVQQMGNLKNIESVIRNSTSKDVFYNLEASACNGRRIKSPPLKVVKVPVSSDIATRTKAIAAIDEQLNKKNPSAISYYPEYLKNENAGRSGKPHASTVVGRQLNKETGRCEYLIRNSYGSTCPNPKSSPKVSCKNGNYWVSREDLNAIINGTTYLE